MRALFILCLTIAISMPAFSEAINGGVEKRDLKQGSNQVIDSTTGYGIPEANVSLPAKKFSTTTDDEGRFQLGTKITAPTIMSVNKDGYRPFSLTLDSETTGKPLVVGIEKSTPKDLVLETDMIHLGDNNFSQNSANAGDFAVKSIGPFYSKEIKVSSVKPGESIYINIGSIIGIDTMTSRNLGQSKVTSTYADPPQVFVNGNKIAEIKINGDGQEIKIPPGIVKENQLNEITIKAGKNLFQTSYIDYDDIEFTNLQLEVK